MNRIETYIKLFENSPIASAILEAGTLKVELANDAMLKLWRREPEVIGMNLLDFMPELRGQPYPHLMNEVLRTGKYYHETGSKAIINRAGIPETVYVDYSYTPIPGDNAQPSALLILANDVSEKEMAHDTSEDADRELRILVMSAQIPMGIFKGENLDVEIANQEMADLWNLYKDILKNPLRSVFSNGMTYTEQIHQILYSYTPLKDDLGKTCGVVLTGIKNG